MQHAIVFVLLIAAVAVSNCADSYTTKYDSLNIDSILSNRRLVDNYVKCMLDKQRCNEEGRTLKEIIPDALVTDCRKCNAKQRASVEKVVSFLAKNRRSDFDALAAKYDPQGTYRSKYEKYLH